MLLSLKYNTHLVNLYYVITLCMYDSFQIVIKFIEF